MKKLLLTTIISGFAICVAAPSIGDGKNWSEDKAAQVEANRNSNAGIGNGGERKKDGEWQATVNGEDGGGDVDPGNSGDNNNACPTPEGSKPKDTAC